MNEERKSDSYYSKTLNCLRQGEEYSVRCPSSHVCGGDD